MHRLPRGPRPSPSRPRGAPAVRRAGQPSPPQPPTVLAPLAPSPRGSGPGGSHLPQRRHPRVLQFSRCGATWAVRPSVRQPARPLHCRRSNPLEPSARSVLTAGACALGARGGTGARGGGRRAAASGKGPGPRLGERQASAPRPRPALAARPPGAPRAHGPGSARTARPANCCAGSDGSRGDGGGQEAPEWLPGAAASPLHAEQVLTALESKPARPTRTPTPGTARRPAREREE